MRLPSTTRAGAAGSRCLLKFARSPSLLRDFTRRKREKERDDLSLTCDGSAQGRRVKYFVFYAIEKYVRVRKKVRGRRCYGRMPSRRSMPVVTRVPCHAHGIAPDDVSVATVAVAIALLPSVSFFFFFFVYSLYSFATYLDHDEYYVQSVSPPQSACSGTVQAPFCPPPRPIPQGAST